MLADLEGLFDVPRHRARQRQLCPRRSSTRASSSTARSWPARQAARSLEARRLRHRRRARRGRRQALRRALFPAGGEGARRGDGAQRRSPPSRSASIGSTGWRRRRRRRRRPSSRRSRSASAIPTSGATTRRSTSSAATRIGNCERAELFEYRRNLAKLGQPIDRGEWVMTPQLVNAVNLPAMNALNFPAAILQPPFFDPKRPAVDGLRRGGRDHRPRDQPQLRRSGRALRRRRQAAQLVDAGGLRALYGVVDGAGQAVRRLSARSPTCTSTAS